MSGDDDLGSEVVEREEESCGEKTEEGGDSEELVEEEGTDDDFERSVDLAEQRKRFARMSGWAFRVESARKRLTRENEWKEKSATLSTSTVIRVILRKFNRR